MDAVRFALLGMSTGSLYALVALGVVVVYRSTGVLNFGAGAVGAAGAYVCYDLRETHGLNGGLAILLGLVVGACLGALTQFVIMGLLRSSSPLVKLIGSLGVMLSVQGAVFLIWDNTDRGVPEGFLPDGSDDRFRLFGISGLDLTWDRVIIISIMLLVVVGMQRTYTTSTFGLATTAVSENPVAAASGGWSPKRIELVNFALAGVLSAGAAILLTPIVGLQASTLTLMILPALAAALVGGFASFALTVVGAVVIGIAQAEIRRFVTAPQWIGLPDAVPLIVVVVIVVAGGAVRLGRGDFAARLPLPGTGRVRTVPFVVSGIIMLYLLSIANEAWADALIVSFATATLMLSLVVVTGYAGQLSLCQVALAGFGCWIASRLVSTGTPFALGVALATILTIPVGLIVAVPALRTRGVSLAVVTLGLAVVINSLILSNSSLTGGYFGTVVKDASFFGWNIDPVKHPQRFALLTVCAFVLAAFVVANVRRGRSGRRLLAVRSNERAAAALGVGVYGAKLYAFGLAAGLAGLAGAFLGLRHQNIIFSQFGVFQSILAVQFAVIGGIGWIIGALLGGLGSTGGVGEHGLTSLFEINKWLPFIGGVSVILVLTEAPDGLAAIWSHRLRRLTARADRRQESRRPRRFQTEPSRRREPCSLAVDNVSVAFGGFQVLKDASFSVAPGEVLGLIGPNGAGKTTMLDVITGFTKPDQGSVKLGSERVDRWSPEHRARAGLVRSFQGVELFEEMTVRDNLLVAADPQSRSRYLVDLVHPGRRPRSEMMERVVADFKLEAYLDLRPSAVPHTVARMVAIARAIVAEPAILLLDEPAAGLDPVERSQLGREIRRVVDELNIGVVLIEHDMEVVMSVCDRVCVLEFGHIIAEGTPAEVQANPNVVRAYLGEPAVEVSEALHA